MHNELYHWGIKGMKWGVRRYQNEDGTLTLAGRRRYGETHSRTLRTGTEVQNISRRRLESGGKKSNRLYASYTDYDKSTYEDMMGNFQYDGHGYKNTFVVKKDIKIASEQDVANTFAQMFKENPEAISNVMAKAYNAVNVPLFFKKNGSYYRKKLSELSKDPSSEKSIKLGREFIQLVPMSTKTSDAANDFYTRMVKQGFDAVLDTNDAYGLASTQDPLIIFNMEKLGNVKSVKLTKDDLDSIWEYTSSKAYKQKKKNVSQIAHTASTSYRDGEHMRQNELYHWGIKGQKWGVRRYQNRDGTLTPAGKKRYADDPEYQDQLINAKQNYKRAFAVYAKNPYSLSNKKRYKNAKKDYEDAKAKVNIPIKKTEHVLQLEEEYRKKGYTSEEAELAAYKRNTTEKVLIAIGVGAITAGAIYAGYKFYDRNIDKTLKVGTVLQNISTNGNKGIEDAFYAAYNPLDKMKYKGIYGKQLRSSSLKKVYSTESKVKETGLKIASVNNAKKTFVDLMNSDSEFNKMVTDEISSQHNSRFFVGTPKQKDMFKKAVDAINSGRINDNSVYNAMNYMRVSHDERGQNISKKFYSALKSKGYSAIQDINDKYDSGYNAIQPLIVFGGKDTLSISNRKVLEAREITKNNKAAMNMLAADVIKSKVVVPYGAGIVAMYSGTKIGDLYGFKKDSEIVSEYKKKHPNSNLSAKEIISNYKSK